MPQKHKGGKGRGKWSRALLGMAQEFKQAEQEVVTGCWKAAEVALRMKAEFPDRARDMARSWETFVKEVLGKSRATVYSYLAAARYAEENAEGWRDDMAGLPPVWMVARLAAVPEGDEREVLHSQLWAGDYENDQMMLDEMENVRKQHAAPPEPQPWKTGECKGVRPQGARQPKAAAKPQVLPLRKAAEFLSEAIGDEIRVIPGPTKWSDLESLLEDLDEKITANLKSLRKTGAVIVIRPSE